MNIKVATEQTGPAAGAVRSQTAAPIDGKLTFSKESRIFSSCPLPPKPKATSGIR
jgi:hypothetical protein